MTTGPDGQPKPTPTESPEAEAALRWMGAHKGWTTAIGLVVLLIMASAGVALVKSFMEFSDDVDKSIVADKKAEQKGSDAPTPKETTKPATPEQKLTKVIRDKLGKSNRDVARVDSVVYNDDGGLGAIVIRWAINDNLTEGLTKKSAKLDISEMLEVIQEQQKDGLNVQTVTLSGTFPLTDNLGDTKELKVVNATYSGATVKKINFGNFLNKNVYEIADPVTIHPAFKD